MNTYTNGQEVEVLLGRDWQPAVYIGRNVPSRRYPHVVYRYGMGFDQFDHEKIRPKAPTLAEWLESEECRRLRNEYGAFVSNSDNAREAWERFKAAILEHSKQ